MSSSLLDTLTSLAGPSLVGSVATKLGEPEQAVSRGMTTGFASILAGLVAKVGEESAFSQIFDIIGNNPATAAVDSPNNLASMIGTGGPLASMGQQFLSAALPGNVGSVSNLIASTTGLRPDSASSILSMAAPIVLGVLGKRVADGGMNAAGLGNLLLAEKDSILRAAPAGVGNLFGLTDMARSAAGAALGATRAVNPSDAGAGGRRWPWLLLLLALLALLWGWLRKKPPTSETGIGPTADTMMRRAQSAAETAVARTGAAVSALGAMVKRNLPSGLSLNVPERGTESRMIAFIEDRNMTVTDTTWFNFDRIVFKTGSAELEPQSQEQLKNIADIMSAYPNVAIKIGGYTDNTGSPAANLKLSQDRAESVRRALQDMGVASSRLAAEGYGEKHPVADNSTEEGRAMNRRIALRVTKK